jgi:NAD(P)-dependent dehydrogenase (short-subunit alcohol dehydrogenase family)
MVTTGTNTEARPRRTRHLCGLTSASFVTRGISGSSVGDPDGLDGWPRIIAVNQTSVFLGAKLAAEQPAKGAGRSIVNISSIMGFVGNASGHPAYHAAKGAVRIYSKAAAGRYGPSAYGSTRSIRATCRRC